LQLEELTGGVEDDRRGVARDYFVESESRTLELVINQLAELSDEDILDLRVVASLLGITADPELDTSVQPRGYRLLARIPRLPDSIADHVIERFGRLPKIMRASISDLVSVEGVGEARARAIKDGLARVAESSILDRYS
jgi:diadenylate cyclase